MGLFEVDELWLARVARELDPRAILLGNLFRDQLDRYGELEAIADSWQELLASSAAHAVLNADDPSIADLGRERAGAERSRISESTTTRSRWRAWPTRPTPSTAATAALPTSSTRSISATSATTTAPRAGGRGPQPAVLATDVRLEGVRGARFALRDTGRRSRGRARAARASTTSTTLSPPPPWGPRSGSPLEDIVAGLAGDPARVRARRDHEPAAARRRRRAARAAHPARQEPGRSQRGAAHARTRARRAHAARSPQRPDRRRPRRVVDLGRRLRAAGRARAARRLQRYARGRPGRAAEVRRASTRATNQRSTASSSGRSQEALSLGDRSRPLYALPTYTSMLALRELLVARGEARSAWL